ncbi:MAG: HEAT repeat domain-containing protein, partial [Planctomycetota bacterium]
MWPAACLALLLLAPPPPSPPPGPPPAAPAGPALADAPRLERQTLESLLGSTAWTRRAVAVLRLERFACPETAEMLRARLDDPAWQVRAFAARTLGRRRVALPDDGFADEHEPRVLRAALRARYPIGPERLGRGVRYLARSGDLEQMMLAVELGAASGDDDLRELARATARKVILRMGRTDAGTLSPRLAAVTGQRDLRRHTLWKQ